MDFYADIHQRLQQINAALAKPPRSPRRPLSPNRVRQARHAPTPAFVAAVEHELAKAHVLLNRIPVSTSHDVIDDSRLQRRRHRSGRR